MSVSKLSLQSSLISLIAFSVACVASDTTPYETAAKNLQQRLGKVLTSTIRSDGHIAAIDVCNEQAPEIANALSEELGLTVGRTALKVRNPDNAPNAKQKQVLKAFESLWERTKEKPPSATYTDANGREVWMKAIVMQPQCAACHGTAVTPEVRQAISEHYPEDEATGFDVGNIRGAFVVRSNNPDK